MKKSPLIVIVIFFIVWVVPFIIVVKNSMSGSMPFWYDPARDMLMALENLSKPTLIGPTSGIPGIFYGPYWIWLLSSALLFTKDPRVVTFLTEALPYFTLFPFLLWQFRKLFGMQVILIVWLLFIFSFSGYALQLWNPHLAPLFFLATLYLITFTNFYEFKKSTYLKTLLLGVTTALTFNFHISFGLGLAVGVIAFLLIDSIYHSVLHKQLQGKVLLHRMGIIGAFLAGSAMTFMPFLFFEIRHGFMQIQTAIKTMSSPVAVVSQHGLTKQEILSNFFSRIGEASKLPKVITSILSVSAFAYVIYFLGKNKYNLKDQQVKLLSALSIISLSILTIYLNSKNPVWDYHFIAVEIIFLLILAFLMSRFKLIKIIIALLVGVLFISNSISLLQPVDPLKLSSLAAKQYVVAQILEDAKESSYTIYVYNPSIYNYDYVYLLQAKGIDFPYDPGKIVMKGDTIYLVIPKVSLVEQEDFINNHAPNKMYKTEKTWHNPDGTTILKKIKNNP